MLHTHIERREDAFVLLVYTPCGFCREEVFAFREFPNGKAEAEVHVVNAKIHNDEKIARRMMLSPVLERRRSVRVLKCI